MGTLLGVYWLFCLYILTPFVTDGIEASKEMLDSQKTLFPPTEDIVHIIHENNVTKTI